MSLEKLTPYLIAIAAALPGTAVRLLGIELSPPVIAALSGTAILGASFLLLWACDAAQADISQTLSLAVVALIAVLPEYAVDMYFTWQAGKFPDTAYAHYAIANMTGANRLLIGVAWGAIAVIFFFKHRKPVRLGKDRRTELLALAAATVYAFIIPFKGTLAWYDGLVFLGIYVAYIYVASQRPCGEAEADGPAELLIHLPRNTRRIATASIFIVSAFAILANSKPFCEGLVQTGKQIGIDEFVLVQWLAPIASEAPEFVVALMFAWRGNGGLALGSLLSSKLNQWTLLVGMIPGIFAFSHGTLQHPMPMDVYQMHEILLTAAQSLLGLAMLACLRFTLSNALLLFALFIGQLIVPSFVDRFPAMVFNLDIKPHQVHQFFSALYLMGSAAIVLEKPMDFWNLRKGLCDGLKAR